MSLQDPATQLRDRGLRVTAQRLAVLRAVIGGAHVTADAVAESVRTEVGAISQQAVYDALGALVEVGLVRRLQPAGSPTIYESRRDNHHHVICRSCGSIADVNCAVGPAPCLTAEDSRGYEIDEAEVFYWGTCPGCRAARSQPGASPRPAPTPRHAADQAPPAGRARPPRTPSAADDRGGAPARRSHEHDGSDPT